MNELQIFSSEEFGEIRAITKDNETYFVGKDVAKALGFTNPRDAIATHVFDEDKGGRHYRHPWWKAEYDCY